MSVAEEQTVVLLGRPLRLRMTPAARQALTARTTPLQVEIHLIFGCLIVKRVRFKEALTEDAEAVQPRLYLRLRTVRYQKSCRLSDIDADEDPEDFPLAAEKSHFVPAWVDLDYRDGHWCGVYGYDRNMTTA